MIEYLRNGLYIRYLKPEVITMYQKWHRPIWSRRYAFGTTGFVDCREAVVREFGRYYDAYFEVLRYISDIRLDADSHSWVKQMIRRCQDAMNQAYEWIQGGTVGILEHEAVLAIEIVRHFVRDTRLTRRELTDPVDSVDAMFPVIQRLLDSPWDLRLLFKDLVLAEPEDSGVLRGLTRETYRLSLDREEDTENAEDIAA